MPVLRITFKQNSAARYRISWKPSTSSGYQGNDYIVVNRIAGQYQTVDINIPTYEGYDFKIEALCTEGVSVPWIGDAIAPCLKVSGEGTYDATKCPAVDDIILNIT